MLKHHNKRVFDNMYCICICTHASYMYWRYHSRWNVWLGIYFRTQPWVIYPKLWPSNCSNNDDSGWWMAQSVLFSRNMDLYQGGYELLPLLNCVHYSQKIKDRLTMGFRRGNLPFPATSSKVGWKGKSPWNPDRQVCIQYIKGSMIISICM